MIETIISIFTDTEKLLIALPVIMIAISVIVILISYIKPKKAKTVEIKEEKKVEEKKIVEKVNFREELERISRWEDYNRATRRLFILTNKFLSQLFEIKHAFTYEEIKKEANTYGFKKIKEMCELLSVLNFAKDDYSEEDFNKLKDMFTEVLDSYETMINGKTKDSNDKPKKMNIFSKIKKFMQRKGELEKYLRSNNPELFEKDGIDYTGNLENMEGDNSKAAYLIKLGLKRIREGKLESANSIDEAVKELNLSQREEEMMSEQIGEFRRNLINSIGVKAAEEIMYMIEYEMSEGKEKEAKKLFKKLEYIYERLSQQEGIGVYKEWTKSIKNWENTKNLLINKSEKGGGK